MTIEDKAVEESAKAIRQYLDPMLLKSLSELGLLVKDQVAFWRFRNQVRMLTKSKEILEKAGIDSSQVKAALTPDLIIPLIESAGDTESEDLSEMFAALMSSSINPQTFELGHPSFAKVLGQLSPLDARVMKSIYISVNSMTARVHAGESIEDFNDKLPIHKQLTMQIEKAAPAFGVSQEQMLVVFQNLRRLGVCDQGHDVLNFMNRKEVLSLTDYGMTLCRLCIVVQ